VEARWVSCRPPQTDVLAAISLLAWNLTVCVFCFSLLGAKCKRLTYFCFVTDNIKLGADIFNEKLSLSGGNVIQGNLSLRKSLLRDVD
jgi:hypothetical protein